jgi:DNA-binding winged helix-turn-helix (wHTH) protein
MCQSFPNSTSAAMHDSTVPPRHVNFGPFELDVRSGELRKGSTRLKVPDQSIEILKALIEHPGELVTREQLRERLWLANTFVDFEHGLNAAIRRLREALGDSAEAPKYIETLPRRGYRFIGSVEGVPVLVAVPEASVPIESTASVARTTSPSLGSHPAHGTPDTGDAALDLGAPSTTSISTRARRTIRRRPRWLLGATVVGLIVAASFTAWLSWPGVDHRTTGHDCSTAGHG